MKKIWIKFLLKLIKINIEKDLDPRSEKELKRWLFSGYQDNGWQQYHTIRKRSLLQLLSLGIEQDKEYWQAVGRIKELDALNLNIRQEGKSRKKKEKGEEDKKD